MAEHLPLLLRHYASLTPTVPALLPSPPFPSSAFLSLPSTQQYLVDHLLSQGQDEGAQQWRRSFWKRVVRGIEDGTEERRKAGDEAIEDEEVHPDILEAMVELLSSSLGGSDAAPGISTRTYYWGELRKDPGEWEQVKTREEGRMISGGTTGLRTWQACIALSNHLISSPAILSSSHNVLELGAGVGLLSLVAARLLSTSETDGGRGRRVVATDVDEKVLEMLKSNVELNGCASLLTTTKLDWELASEPEVGLSKLREWEDETFGKGVRPDLILGADIVYDPTLAGHLAAVLAFLLRPSDSSSTTAAPQALIAATIRNEATWALFLFECRSRSLTVDSLQLSTPPGKAGIVGAEGYEGEGEVRLVRIVAVSAS